MSDFLTNLVMRSFAKTPSVQPMALSTYAAPEPQPQIDPDPVEQIVEPVQKTEVVKNTDTDKRESLIEKVPLVTEAPPVVTSTSVHPVDHFENSELHQPEVTHESVVLEEPRVMSKPDNTIAPPAQSPQQRIVKPAVQVQKVSEPLIVEQVIEHVVERPTVKSIERPTVTTIEHSTRKTIERPSVTSIERSVEHSTEQPTVTTIEHSTSKTIERPSVTSIERSVEHSTEQPTVTIENTEHVTNSFTTLVPKVTPQSLPALNVKSRPAQSQVAAVPDAEQEQAPTAAPETVINVAIGRIEVRATPAPATRRERQQHGPKVMTLDDYLQQRSRGTQ